MGIRERIELLFIAWGNWVCKNPWRTIASMLAIVAGLAIGLPHLKFEGSTENYIDPNDPARVAYNEFREQFVYDDFLLLLVRSDQIFSLDFLDKLRALHRDLETEITQAEEVTSLVNARLTRGEGDELIVGELMEAWPTNAQDLALIEARAKSNPLYRNVFLSENGRMAAINVRVAPSAPQADPLLEGDGFGIDAQASTTSRKRAHILEGEELDRTVEKAQEIVARHQSDGFPILLTGLPEMSYALVHECSRDAILFMVLGEILIFALLFAAFRRTSGVWLPLVVVTASVFSTFGAMGLLDIAMTPSTQFLPSFILVACVGDSVHLLSLFYQRFDQGATKSEAIAYALGHSGLAVLMTSITTAASLGAFAFADLVPLQGLGLAAPIGVMLGFLYSVALLPALLQVVPVRRRAAKQADASPSRVDRLLVAFGDFSALRPWTVVLLWSALSVFGLWAAAKLRPSHDTMRWFPPGFSTRVAADTANAEMKGVMTVEVVVDTGHENGLISPAMLNRLDEAEKFAEGVQEGYIVAGQSISLVDIVKETHQALNGNDPAFYAIPQDQELLAQELLLFESSGADDLHQFVDGSFQRARISLRVPFEDGFVYIPYVEELERGLHEIFGDDAKVQVTGLTALFLRTISAMLSSTIKSYSLSILMVAPLMILLIGELRMGVLSLVPNLMPILVGLGFMHVVGIPFDMFTMMIGSIAIGIAVDDTIHFMHTYRRYHSQGGDAYRAVHATLTSSGRGMLFTSVALTAGFLIQGFGQMVSVRNLGLATGFTIAVALLADLTLSPALVILMDRSKRRAAAKNSTTQNGNS